ncbi:hypothetical protein ACFFSY_11555 [Paenibacillus aurantiacus]|uniref:Uncharacterized protein n=1 Tax=Paenibacillus aurantiacus TaxID=1936118 RepID=A0ABV5KNT3_9BACL
MTHRKNVALLVCVAVVIAALVGYVLLHTFTREISGTVEGSVGKEVLEFNCSDQIRKWNGGSGDDIGYLCEAHISANTTIEDSEGNPITLADIANGDRVRILLSKPYNKRDIHAVKARKVIVLHN